MQLIAENGSVQRLDLPEDLKERWAPRSAQRSWSAGGQLGPALVEEAELNAVWG